MGSTIEGSSERANDGAGDGADDDGRVVWTMSSTGGQVELVIEPEGDGRWRYALVRHRGDRVLPLAVGLADCQDDAMSVVCAALDEAGVAARPARLVG